MSVNEIGSYASIIGIFITVVGAFVTVRTYYKVSDLKNEFLLLSLGEQYSKLLSETNSDLDQMIDFKNYSPDDHQKIRERFKSIEGSLFIVLKMIPASYKSLIKDVNVILRLTRKFPEYQQDRSVSKIQECKAALVNVINTLPQLVEEKKLN